MNDRSAPSTKSTHKSKERSQHERLLDIARRPDLSPLRYPGGKRKLVPLIAEVFLQAGASIKTLIEPFAGGAAITLALLESGSAQTVALADKDELVAAFWKTVFSADAEVLADRVLNAPVTLHECDRLRESNPEDELERAYKCLFLNRTSFSGILHRKVPVKQLCLSRQCRVALRDH